jgi:6-pyruvoyltetrahydropterin/6-carboxytetrahydropterin synthase
MTRFTTLHIDKEAHKFSAAHFTIFSATERERLHGHNYSVSACFLAPQGENGFSADYNVYKNRLAILCDELDEYLLLAGDSPHQTIKEEGGNYRVEFVDDEMLFLAKDTLVLPVRNVTVEELAHYLLGKLVQLSQGEGLREIELCVSSGPGQKGCSLWRSGD